MDTTEIKAVEMVREIRDRYYELTKDMSPDEERRFYKERAERINAIAQRPSGDSAATQGRE